MRNRMKPSINDDLKIFYELSRKKFQLLNTNLTDAILLFLKMNSEENSDKSESDHSHSKLLRYMKNDELLA